MNHVPLISVVLPVYNGERFIAEAVQSILAQTFGDFELIAIDDGSKDRSKQILDGFATRDARVRVVSRPNAGLVRTLNEGLALARGELLARIDADDAATPDRFERQVAYLCEHPECVAVGSRALMIDSEGDPLIELGNKFTHEEIDSALINGEGQHFYHSSLILRTRALRDVGGYRDLETIEDLDLFLRLAEVGRLHNLREVLLKYRQHPASVGHSKMIKQRLAQQQVLDEAHRRRGIAMPDHLRNLPSPRQLSRSEQHVKWAWWALQSGFVSSARKHAFRALKRAPLSKHSWKVMYCALRGR
ncbi:MAG: glycosyltransferase family 2 protein [Tepidisphaeraceae bacterium]